MTHANLERIVPVSLSEARRRLEPGLARQQMLTRDDLLCLAVRRSLTSP
jgi:hypothetical protein